MTNILTYIYFKRKYGHHQPLANNDIIFHPKSFDIYTHILAHDLKAPLFAIRNLATWIKEDANHLLPVDSQRHLALLLKRIKRMETLLADIFTYFFKTNSESHKTTIHWPLYFDQLKESIYIPQGFTIIDRTNLAQIITNSLLLHIVIANLITNAIKHHHDITKGIVILSGVAIPNGFKFIISDNGPGIDTEYHSEIFKPLRKLESHDKVEGSGLGLAIVKKIVEQQGGCVHVESQPRSGCHFIFTWVY